ncbi:MAG: amino acid adenylation domain-containing protein, partial [Myxococcales bacterium]|nr:amino acid adenylation domain-containing protein [Myxococcales bacterium]
VLRAGAAFVPLDPDWPAERLAWMADDAGLAALLCDGEAPPWAPARCLRLDGQRGASRPAHAASADHAAYVIYTSGSTGRPKGVVVSRGAAARFLSWTIEALGWQPGERVLVQTPISFDAAVRELLAPLVAGATAVVLAEGAEREPARAIAEVRAHAVNSLKLVPTALPGWLEALERAPVPTLRTVISAGEALPAALRDRALAVPGLALFNQYGPTEAAVAVTTTRCTAEPGAPGIGGPVAGTRLYVLDGALRRVGLGVSGELYIGGAQLARGYHRLPAETAARFVPDPFGPPGARLYRSGDRARWRRDGQLDFMGRADAQVKIRGFRVEPGEVEAALAACAGVTEAAVVARATADGHARLFAFVVGGDPEAVRQELAARLPAHLLPARIIALAALPRTPSGKLDRKALPAAEVLGSGGELDGPAEQAVADIWAEVLELPASEMAPEAGFFALGGDSILALKAVRRLQAAGWQLSVADLFAAPDLRALAANLGRVAGLGQAARPGPLAAWPMLRWYLDGRPARPGRFAAVALWDVPADLDFAAVQSALLRLAALHDAVRLRLDGEPSIHADAVWPIEAVDLSGAADLRAAVRQAADQLQSGLALPGAPLVAARLLKLPSGQRRLLLTAHHAVADASSVAILAEDLAALLAGAHPAPAPTGLRRFVEHGAGRLASGEFNAELSFWRAQVTPALVPPLPAARGEVLELRVDVDLGREAEAILLTALARALPPEAGLALQRHGRGPASGLDLARTVGWTVSLFPIRPPHAADPAEHLRVVREALRAVPGQGAGYGWLRHLHPDAEVRAALATQPAALLNHLGHAAAPGFAPETDWLDALPGILHRPGVGNPVAEPWAHCLSVVSDAHEGALRLRIVHHPQAHDRAAVARFGEALRRELQTLAALPPDLPLAGAGAAALLADLAPGEPIVDAFPLTPMQEGMLFHTRMDGGAQVYVQQATLDLPGDVDLPRLEAVWATLVRRHACLRTSFHWQGLRRPLQAVHRDAALPLQRLDLSHLTPEDAKAQVAALEAKERAAGFDLRRPPAMRLWAVRLPGGRVRVIQTYHHLLLDAWSHALLHAEAQALFAGRDAPPTPAFRDYVAWLEAQPADAAEAYFRARLGDLGEPFRLPLPRPAAPDPAGRHRHAIALPPRQLEALARAHGVTPRTVVQAAIARVLAVCAGRHEVLYGLTTSGRGAPVPGIERMLGLFINTLPLRLRVAPEAPLGPWLRDLQTAVAELMRHEATPLATLQRWTRIAPGTPLIETLVVFRDLPGGIETPREAFTWSSYPLTIYVDHGRLVVVGAADRFDADEVARIGARLSAALESLRHASTLADITALPAAERAWLAERDAGPEPQALPDGLAALIRARAIETPDAVALIGPDATFTYAQLDAAARRLAGRLRQLGVRPEARVGLYLERSARMVVAMLATVQAGGAYVGLDPAYPQARLRAMVDNAAPTVLLSQRGLATDWLPHDVTRLDLDVDFDAEPLPIEPPGDLLYLFYTSGSTGRPKGVAIEHRSALALLEWADEHYGSEDLAGVLAATSVCFDLSVFEIFLPLTRGGAVVLEANALALADPDRQEAEVRLINTVPPAMAELVHGGAVPASVRTVNLAGEALPRE